MPSRSDQSSNSRSMSGHVDAEAPATAFDWDGLEGQVEADRRQAVADSERMKLEVRAERPPPPSRFVYRGWGPRVLASFLVLPLLLPPLGLFVAWLSARLEGDSSHDALFSYALLLGVPYLVLAVRSLRVRVVADGRGVLIANVLLSHLFPWDDLYSVRIGQGGGAWQSKRRAFMFVEVWAGKSGGYEAGLFKSFFTETATATRTPAREHERLLSRLGPLEEIAAWNGVPCEFRPMTEFEEELARDAARDFREAVGQVASDVGGNVDDVK